MELHVERIDDVTLVCPQAEFLDANTSLPFKDEVLAVLAQTNKLVLDLHHVQFMDSAGCGVVLALVKKLRTAGGDLKVCCLTNPVRALFDLVRMHRIFGVFKRREEAVASFGKK